MVRPGLAVVIPCHNESATVGRVAGEATRHGTVIVVDDRSTDGSRAAAEAAGAMVAAAEAPGYDGAIATGLRLAYEQGFERVVTMDADGEHDPACLAAFAAASAPLVCGIRPAPQRVAERLIARMGRLAYGIDDPLCGMKGYSRAVLEAWFASGAPLLVNMAPAVVWRKAGGGFEQVRVTGERRLDRPRFGRALKANLVLLRAWAAALQLPATRAA